MLVGVEKLIEKNPQIDYLFIETTGLADPGPLVRAFWADTELESSVYLDAIICVIDSLHFKQQLDMIPSAHACNEAQRQAAFADVILLNKCDLVTKEQLEELDSALNQINAVAKRYKTTKGKIGLNLVLDLKQFDFARAIDMDPHLFNKSISTKKDHHKHADDIPHADDIQNANQPSGVYTTAILVDGYVDLHKLSTFLGKLLWENKSVEIYRIKGVINAPDSMKINLQAVHELFDIQPSGIYWGEQEKRQNKIVFIGRNLNHLQLEQSFTQHCIITQSEHLTHNNQMTQNSNKVIT